MPRSSSPRDSATEVPQRLAETPPSSYPHTVEMGYIVENLMQIQNSLGGLREAVDTLKTSSHSHGTKLDNISKIIFASGVVLVVVLSIAGFLLNKIWGGLVEALVKGSGHS